MDDIKSLAEEIERNNFMLAALHHKSARKSASAKLKEYRQDDRIIDAWESLGKSVLSLYSACRSVDIADKTSGACSLVERKVKVRIYEQLGKKIRSTNKGKFGSGVPAKEKSSIEITNSLTNQLLGAIQHNLGFTRLTKDFIEKYLSLDSIDIVPEKDSKTQLQEYCQSIKKPLPSYSLLEEIGPAHSRTFKVRVDALSISCDGTGPSKRLAELQAAGQFIEKHSIRVPSKRKPVNANKKTDYISAAKLMPLPPNSRKVGLIVEKLMLPAWSVTLVGLALTHRSYNLSKSNPILGKNNSVLAYLGASVLEWIAFDTAIRNISLDDLSKAGGIREIVRALVNESSISTIYEELLSQDALLLGPGEKNLTQAIKTEFVQALFGVLFLVKEKNLEQAIDLINDTPIFLDYFVNKPKSIDWSRDEIAPTKTVFQEKCQFLGLKVKFQTNVYTRIQQRIATPSITLESEYLSYVLKIQGEVQSSRNNDGKPNVVLESEVALKNKKIFEAILFSESYPTFELNQENYVKWILEHAIRLAGNAGKKSGTLRLSRLINKNFLGVGLLRASNFRAFESFIYFTNKFINLKTDTNKADLLKYYGHAGRNVTSNKLKSLSKTVDYLEAELSRADPLHESHDLRDTVAFKSLISEATTYRLKGGDITLTSLGGVIEEFELLQRGKTNIICRADLIEKIVEVDGAHLCLLDVLKDAYPQDNTITIEVDVEDSELCLTISGFTEGKLEAILASSTWSYLKVILPITSITESKTTFKIHISSIIKSATRKISLELWWRYHFKDPYEAAANDRIASILHDVKNSILGYCFTSEHARNKSSGRERYLLAADASRHLDTAIATLRIVKSLSEETGSADISSMKISIFIKSLISELWSWIPNSVNLIFTPCDSQIEICTDEHRLRSLITNIVKNSVEAMGGNGSIYISYNIEKELEGIEFIISDTGPGFTNEQLIALESGVSLKTSKDTGQGIGLMAVMLTSKELGGNIAFSNGENSGATVKIWVPSIYSYEDQSSEELL
ncbi:ATP-binding protein [Pseudomonas sp. NFACC42-2]|uniref:ATP-binding protein n=1 Tax=Pseudomonas sp. NFACC42-2 TaxID=1566193 RepID=UPI0008EDB56E|nr:ATP-binding protein [Pseudomonas sp. NFACC42-2]SFS29054.1 dsRNA-specific ribonuclease [Pseudomonas sp. NFACC42-2]